MKDILNRFINFKRLKLRRKSEQAKLQTMSKIRNSSRF